MIAWTAALLSLALGLASPQETELSPRLEQALQDLERQDPDAATRLRRALDLDRPEALERLEARARFLDEKSRAGREDPARYELFLRHEELEAQARTLVRRILEDSEALEAELREKLGELFDVRLELRRLAVERHRAEFDQQRRRVESEATEGDLRGWYQRVTEGGPRAMRRRLELSRDEDDFEDLAPALQELVRERRPALARELFSAAASTRRERMLRALTRDEPELLRAARRRIAPQLELKRTLRARVRAAHSRLLELSRATAPTLAELPADALEGLRAIVRAERALGQSHLQRAGTELERQSRLLGQRAEVRSVIVEIQLDRLLGRGVYEW